MFQNPLACGRPLTIYHGGKSLNGTVQLDGAKHMFAHISACAALAQHVTFEHVPNNLDAVAVRTAMQILFKKVHVDLERKFLELSDPQNQKEIYIPYELATLSRSLFGLMPALLQRTHRLIFATLPTGCSIGPRPFHWYFDIMRQFGVHISETNGQIELFKEHLHPTHIHFAKPSMTGSVIAIAMAMSVPGRSMITNVSDENCMCRKPRPGMLLQARDELNINLNDAFFVGDAISDICAALAAGVQPILVLTGRGLDQLHYHAHEVCQPFQIAMDLWHATEMILRDYRRNIQSR